MLCIIIILVIVLIVLILQCLENKEKFGMNATEICNNGCFAKFSNAVNDASDKCRAEFPYPDDQQKCIENAPAYKASKTCENLCGSQCPRDICLGGCHYLYDQNISDVAARCNAEYPTHLEQQKCLEGSQPYQGNSTCIETCSSCE